jgi:type IV secretion system protein TrbB
MNSRETMRNRLQDQLCNDLGEPVLTLLDKPGVTDVLLLEDGTLWSCEHGRWASDPFKIYEPEEREAIIGLVAHSLRQEATFLHPNIEGEMEIDQRRFRFTGLMPPVVAFPTIAIRKPAQVIYTGPTMSVKGSLLNGIESCWSVPCWLARTSWSPARWAAANRLS